MKVSYSMTLQSSLDTRVRQGSNTVALQPPGIICTAVRRSLNSLQKPETITDCLKINFSCVKVNVK
jgi:hypothetical protein